MKTVYTIDNNRILIGERIADMDPLEPNRMVLMLNEIEAKPLPPKAGCVVRHNEVKNLWEYEEDHRGEMVFDPDNGAQITIDAVGSIDHYAKEAKPSQYHNWDAKTQQWKITKANQEKLNTELEEREKAKAMAEVDRLRQQCDKDILPLQDAVDLDEATPEELIKLKELKRHRIALNRWEYPELIPN